MVRLGAVLALAAPLLAAPRGEEPPGRAAEARILRRWGEADAEERRRMRAALDAVEDARRFADARPVVVELGGRALSLAEVFAAVLEPALATPTAPANEADLGLADAHRLALDALRALRQAYAAPHPAGTGTLNLFLTFAHASLDAPALPAAARLRFVVETLRNVRELDGRALPDARTRWLLDHRVLPALLGLARRTERDRSLHDAISEAASLLYLPSILDGPALSRLAPLTRGTHAREMLLRAYRRGEIDDAGVVALARSTALQARDDAAFAAGAPVLFLELLADPRLGGRERALLLDVAIERLAPVEPLAATVRDLLAAGFGGPPRPLEDCARERAEAKGPVAAPRGGRSFRFLSVVLLQPEGDRPPAVARVVRADVPHYAPIHAPEEAGRRFLGMLVPSAEGEGADFLGPPPGLAGGTDNRLLRRTLHQERVSVAAFGARGEEIELTVALPEDASDPVPARGAGPSHVLDLARARLERTADDGERRDLVRLLVRLGTEAAWSLAARHATSPATLAELLPLADRGHAESLRALLRGAATLDLETAERAFGSALRARDAALADSLRALCAEGEPGVAVLAADALLDHGDARGVRALLGHRDRHARLAATSLALRLTPLAGSLRVIPGDGEPLQGLGPLAAGAFDRERDGAVLAAYGRWLDAAFRDAEEVRRMRHRHKDLNLDGRTVGAAEFADAWAARVRDGEGPKYWPQLAYFLLQAEDPGRGIPEERLAALLDALEAKATAGLLRQVWVDSLVALACAQSAMEADARVLGLAQERLLRAAGEGAPAGARRKPGVFWPIWAAREAAAGR